MVNNNALANLLILMCSSIDCKDCEFYKNYGNECAIVALRLLRSKPEEVEAAIVRWFFKDKNNNDCV